MRFQVYPDEAALPLQEAHEKLQEEEQSVVRTAEDEPAALALARPETAGRKQTRGRLGKSQEGQRGWLHEFLKTHREHVYTTTDESYTTGVKYWCRACGKTVRFWTTTNPSKVLAHETGNKLGIRRMREEALAAAAADSQPVQAPATAGEGVLAVQDADDNATCPGIRTEAWGSCIINLSQHSYQYMRPPSCPVLYRIPPPSSTPSASPSTSLWRPKLLWLCVGQCFSCALQQ